MYSVTRYSACIYFSWCMQSQTEPPLLFNLFIFESQHYSTVLYHNAKRFFFIEVVQNHTLSFTFIFNLALILHNKVFLKNVARVLYLYGTIDMGLYCC